MGNCNWVDDLPARLRRWAERPDSDARRQRIVGHLIAMAEAIAADGKPTASDLANLRTACCFACSAVASQACPSPSRGRGDCPLGPGART